MAPKKNGDHDEKQHIQVVVRCRPLNNTEKKQGAFNIIEVNQEKKEICVKDRPSSSGPMKKFVFDHVFGPRATQMEVYKVTVLPVIEEVLQGYNCTIFAYGQTGSGKTYTMEGEKTENCSWNDDPLAGVIPRAMSQLFSRLNDMDVEYVIRVSYLEIYNEELIDLLGAETDENPKLRIYDDSSRKGSLVITGLEDLPVRSKYEVYQILERGSQRRQTAATNMNAHSSRSHSLFMVSVHMKDTSVDGEELLKVGKLNLVDLAGSECIGRSGAVDKRAREAGNINQSLLTLGRVITALVEHAPHIPYRESKLTRLLKDSLGGHTKTSVIATITPASTFLEETLSTLEYAHRTRNITNKPEINQKLSKTTMLKSYAEEIEKLKKELQAARDKSGVYLPTDSYEEMVAKLNLQQEAIKNYEEEISCLTSEMQKINELFAETREKLEDTTKQLGDTRQTLHVTKKERDEQKHLVKHHVKTEHVLHKQASQLLQTAEESTSDVSGLHAKLDRKRNVEKHNEQVQEQFREKFHGDIERMQNSLKSYSENQIKSLGTIESDLGNLVSRSLTDMKGLSKGINHVINLVTGQVTELHESQARYSKDDKKWAENLTSFCSDSLHGEITRQSGFHRDTFLTVMASIHEITSRIATNLNDICENLEAQLRDQKKSIENFKTEQLDSLNKLKEAGTEFANQQINTTRSHVASAQKTYKSQIEQNELFAEKMRQNVNEMITNMLLTQNNHLKSNIDQLSENLTESCEKEEQFLETLTRNVENMEQLTEQGCSQLTGRCTEDNTHTKQAAEQFKSEVSVLEEKIASLENEMEKFTSVGTEVCMSVSDQIADMIKTHIDSVEGQFSSHQTATKTLTTECSHALEELDSVQTKQNIELTETIQSQQTTLENCCKQTADWSESHSKELESRKQSLVQFFLEEVKKDVPTGTTPERRQFSYPRTLAKTENHSVLLEVFHTEMMMNQATDTPLPLSDPELDADDAESDTAVSVGNHLDISDDSSVKSGSVTSDQDFMLDNKENEIIPDNTGHIKQMKCNHAENAKNGVTQNGVRSTRKRRQMKLLN